jgi:tetratricopeptide (TPR) repeat protein
VILALPGEGQGGYRSQEPAPERVSVGQEIERARVLLAAVTREGGVAPAEATAAYERWVADAGDAPFARYLIRSRPGDADKVRHVLRLQAVQGLPRPELHTVERFEDLILGQLGIEAGLLSPKLLQTVRLVQDKKLEEGKLRRLDELLPRAGFDEKALRLLRHHLSERVLLCRGCLGRYPRRDKGPMAVECPRCAQVINAAACMPSDIHMQLSDSQAEALEKSTESEASGVFETLTVAARERVTPVVRRPRGGQGNAPRALAFLALAALLVLGGVVVVSQRAPKPKVVPPRPVTASGPPTVSAEPVRPRATTLDDARENDKQLAATGKWSELLAVWKGVEATDAATKTQRDQRVAQLEGIVTLAAEATALIGESKGQAATDEQLEARLSAVLSKVPSRAPPFADLQEELERRLEARRIATRAAARKRVDDAVAAARPASGAWAARLERIRHAPPIVGLEVGGRSVDGVLVEGLDAAGFILRLPDGSRRTLRWEDDPPLSLAIFERAARPDDASDHLERVRRALAARDPRAAGVAIGAMALASGLAPGQLSGVGDVAAILSAAPTSAPPVALEGGGFRLRWPTGFAPADLVAARPLTVHPGGGLLIAGDRPQLATGAVDVTTAEAGRVAAAVKLEPTGTSPFLAIDLLGARTKRSYVARWDDAGWTLEVDLGAGSNVLKRGPMTGGAKSARLEVTTSEVVIFLDGVERARAQASSRFERVAARAGAASGPVVVSDLVIEGAIDPAWVGRTAALWSSIVDGHVDDIARTLALRHASRLPALSVEEPRALAQVDPAARERLTAARAALAAGQTREASEALRALVADAPGYLAARWTRGLVALLEGELHTSIETLTPAATATFPEAQATLALALARAGRYDRAVDLARQALDGQPDAAHAFLARVRAQVGDRDPATPLDPALILESLALPQALAPDDPAVRDEEAAVRRALRIESGARARAAGAACVVLGDAEAPAAALAKSIDTLFTRFERALKPRGGAVPVTVALLEGPAWLALVGREGEATYDRATGVLLVKAPVAGLGWELAHAAAEAHIHRWYGAPPPWLEASLAAWFAAPAAGTDPPGLKDALATAPAWNAAAWHRFFELDRTALAKDAPARAKGFGLVTVLTRQAPTLAVLNGLLDKSAGGDPAPWSGDAAVKLDAIDAQVGAAFKKR